MASLANLSRCYDVGFCKWARLSFASTTSSLPMSKFFTFGSDQVLYSIHIVLNIHRYFNIYIYYIHCIDVFNNLLFSASF